MSSDIRKYSIILAVAILFSIFSYSFADAFTTQPDYPEICQQNNEYPRAPFDPRQECDDIQPATQEQIAACPGNLYTDYRACEYVCYCYEITQANNQRNDNIRYGISLLLGIIAISAGMVLNPKKEVNTWIGSGFILGGVITLFISTIGFWSSMHPILRPIVIAAELALVIWIAYKKFQ